MSAESVRPRRRSPPSARRWLRDRDPGAARRDGGNDRNQGRQHDRREHEDGPDESCVKRHRPSGQQGEDRSRRRQRAPQIVEHLPAADRRDGAALPILAGDGAAAEDPGQQLPVAARPAVVAQRGDVVAGGKLLDDLDIGGEAGAGEDALEQIVAEQRRVRHTAGERGLEGVDVVDALAGVGAFAEQVLIDVGDRRGIGIDAAHAGKDALEQRAFAADRQRGRDPRLQHRIALDDPAGGGVEARPVERMRHLADQAADRVARQLRVGVERDDVANVGRREAVAPADRHESGVGRAAQQPVQLVQLAALALPADPAPFAFVPDAPAMEQQEAVAARRRAVALVEPGDALRCSREESGVALEVLGRSIGPVGEQREMQIAFRAGEVMDFQPLDLLLDRRVRRQQRRHRDERAQMRGHAVAQLQGRQERRAEAERHGAVDQRDRRIDGGDRAQEPRASQPCPAEPSCASEKQRQREGRRRQHDGGRIAADAESPV